MNNLRLQAYKVEDLKFINKLENATQLKLQNTYSFNASYTADSKRCVAKLSVTVFDKEYENKFKISFDMLGIFDVLDTSVAKEKLHVEAYYHLFPFAKAFAANLSVNSGMPPIYLVGMDIEKQSIYKIGKNPPEGFENAEV